MQYRIFLALIVTTLFFNACTDKHTTLQKNIDDAEALIFEESEGVKFNEEAARNTISAYEEFVNAFPEDPESPDYLLKAADLYRSLGESENAVEKYDIIRSDYPESEKAPFALFLTGFVYENEVVDLDKALTAYNAFMEQYPDHHLAEDVKFSIDHLGMPPEMIIQQFNQQRESETDTVNTDS